ncbi:MAG: hypothetical protein M3343_03455 [Actinomycetota bacterium]|nr:hypothetical protein [Actinomycetota bacterium]
MSHVGFEQELSKITGVRNVRVVGGARPSEIHVVAGKARSPKQIVRDVQSLAVAGFGVSIDHRIVSVVQIDEDSVGQSSPRSRLARGPQPGRPLVESVQTSVEGASRTIRVLLGWPEGVRSEGSASAGTSRELQARAAMEATVEALAPALAVRSMRIEIEHAFVQAMGRDEAVVVKATVYEGDEATGVTGAVLVDDEVASAGVRALLHAINRKLRPPAPVPA